MYCKYCEAEITHVKVVDTLPIEKFLDGTLAGIDPVCLCPECEEELSQEDVCEELATDEDDCPEYIDRDQCIENKTHLTQCDEDGYCEYCGEQE